MAPRLAHKKSRRGCQRCKARKVKCDEIHPVCTNCSRHAVKCEYSDPFVQASNGSDNLSSLSNDRALSSSAPSPHGPDSPYTDLEDIDHAFTADERRLLELRLLYYFTTVVVNTFSNGPFRQVWSVDSPRLGFEYPFLLNAIFAISSLHMVCNVGETPRIYSDDEKIDVVAKAINRPRFSLGNVDHTERGCLMPQSAQRRRGFLSLRIALLPGTKTSTGFVESKRISSTYTVASNVQCNRISHPCYQSTSSGRLSGGHG
jgi:hypothetical protein